MQNLGLILNFIKTCSTTYYFIFLIKLNEVGLGWLKIMVMNMIEKTFIMNPDIPSGFIVYLKNAFKESFVGLTDISIETTESHTAVKIKGTDITGILEAAYCLGQEQCLFVHGISSFPKN